MKILNDLGSKFAAHESQCFCLKNDAFVRFSGAPITRLAGRVAKRGVMTQKMAKYQLVSSGVVFICVRATDTTAFLLSQVSVRLKKWSSNGPQPRSRAIVE